MFRYLLLGLLRSRGPLHGYALMKVSRTCSGLMVGSGSFYRELQRLAAEGLVASSPIASGDARRAPYEITALGVAALDRWLAQSKAVAASPHHDELTTRALLLDVSADLGRRGLDQCREELMFMRKSIERALGPTVESSRGASAMTRAMILGRCLKRIAVDLEFVDQLCALDDDRNRARDRSTRNRTGRLGAGRGDAPAVRASGA